MEDSAAQGEPFPRWELPSSSVEQAIVIQEAEGPPCAVVLALTAARYCIGLTFSWRPLRPAPSRISTSETIAYIIPALLFTWLVKLLLLRYGGLRAHCTALPIFLGLLAGDATVRFLMEVGFSIADKRI